MVSAFTPHKRIEQPAFNDYIDSWNVPVNADWAIIDKAFGGLSSVNATGLSGTRTLTTAEYQPLKIVVSGTPTAAVNLVVPINVGGLWVVRNTTAGGFAITISSAAGGTAVNIPAASATLVTCDGTSTGMALAITTQPELAAGLDTQVQYNKLGLQAGSANLTFDGTTLVSTGLSTSGSTVLGNAAGDTITIGGTAVTAANGLNFNTNQFVLLSGASEQVAIGVATVGAEKLTVAGSIKSTAGGYTFPDNTIQTTAFAATGVVIDYIGGTLPSGWVWANGRTIGNAASNATNRAHATDTLNLYTLIWNSWDNTVAPIFNSNGTAGTRGANAAADFAANKAIATPDLRGRIAAGMDSFGGSTAAGLMTSATVTPNGTTMGATGGTQTVTLLEADMPSHTHVITNHAHVAAGAAPELLQFGYINQGVIAGDLGPATGVGNWVGMVNNTGGMETVPTNSGSKGGSTSHINTQPTIMLAKIIKL